MGNRGVPGIGGARSLTIPVEVDSIRGPRSPAYGLASSSEDSLVTAQSMIDELLIVAINGISTTDSSHKLQRPV